MRASLLFILLALLFTGGHTSIPHNSSAHTVFQPAEKQLQSVNTTQDILIVSSIYLNTEAHFLIADDIEDEEENSKLLVRKWKQQPKNNLTSFCVSVLSRIHSGTKTARPDGNLLSDKYITQRVLRI